MNMTINKKINKLCQSCLKKEDCSQSQDISILLCPNYRSAQLQMELFKGLAKKKKRD